MTHGRVEVEDEALSVADRIALLEARQDLAWERAGERLARRARDRGDHAEALYIQAVTDLGIDAWIELADLSASAAAI